MKKSLLKIVAVICMLSALCACGISEQKDNTEYIPETDTTTTTNETLYDYSNLNQEPEQTTAPSTTIGVTLVPKSEPASTEVVVPQSQTESPHVTPLKPTLPETSSTKAEEKTYTKTGEMAFSDSPDNKYIKAIAKKYKVNAKNLVALYTVPDNDGNIVLQFDGTKDKNGKLIRNEDTLVSIFTIDKNLDSKCASENKDMNEYSFGEKMVMFLSVKNYIMPEFEEELKG